jgi:hypothetical protein
MVEEWRIHSEKSLKIRHKTGKLLNDYIGRPSTRTKRGEGVVETVCEQLRISKSEASRIRWFALLFSSIEDLQERHPEAKSWSAVKDLLPKLKAERSKLKEGGQSGGAKSGNAGTVKAPTPKRMVKHLKRFSEEFNEVQLHLSGEVLRDLQGQISDILDKVRNRYFQCDTSVSVDYKPLAESWTK